MDFSGYFKDKKITLMGLGLLGRGVGDAAYLAEQGVDLIVTDLKSETELKESIESLKQFPNITFRLGEHQKRDFEHRDFILVGAGVPQDSEYLGHARAVGVPLKQSAALFAELTKIPIIGVTGTRGKSTVTQMIHHTLAVATGETILLGGNVRGVSNLQLFKVVSEESLCVMELDSWQLQGWGWAGMSPQIAVFTNFMEDHQNYYKDMDEYFADKAKIFTNQESTGVLVTTPEVFELAKSKGLTLKQEVVLADGSVLPDDCLLAMPGEHNRLNAALAYEVLKATSLSDDLIFEGLATFPGVEGRLQYVGEQGGVKIYNDNNATTPQATIEGLKAVGTDPNPDGRASKNVVLLCGGSDKGLDVTELAAMIEKYCAHVVLYSGTGTEKLKAVFQSTWGSNPQVGVEEHDTLQACVEAAIATSASGNIFLFSPAFASFGKEYKNEYDRNDQFMDVVLSHADNET